MSGRFLIDRIVTRRSGAHLTRVYYLDRQLLFTEVVSLSTRNRDSQARIIKLLGRIAVLTDQAEAPKPMIASGVTDSWLLTHWGRAAPRR